MSSRAPEARAGGVDGRRRLLVVRVLLAVLAAFAAVPGAWAWAAPHSFYDTFPGVAHWVNLLPPYNEHLTVDVGAFYLAFTLLFAWAAIRPQRALLHPLLAAWALFSSLHLLFHLTHLSGFSMADAVDQSVSLAAVLAAPAAILWLRAV